MYFLISYAITFVALLVFSYNDIKYHMLFSYIPVVAIDLIAVSGCFSAYGLNFITILSSLCLFLALYITEIAYQAYKKKKKIEDDSFIFGGMDIAIAPAITCWFGILLPVFLIFYIIFTLLAKNKKLINWINGFCIFPKLVKEGYYPKIPFMTAAWICSSAVVIALTFLF